MPGCEAVAVSLPTGIRWLSSDVPKSEKSSGFKTVESEKSKSASLKAGAGSVCDSALLLFDLVLNFEVTGLAGLDFRELPTRKFSACCCGTLSSFSLENPWAFIALTASHRLTTTPKMMKAIGRK